MLYKLQDYKNEIKWAWQRVFRGYDDTAYWNLNDYVSAIIIPVLTRYKKIDHGAPFGFTREEWRNELDIMIKGFEAPNNDNYNLTSNRKFNRMRKKGLRSFAKNFDSLWD